MTNYLMQNYILCNKKLWGAIFKPLRNMHTGTLHNKKCGAQQKLRICREGNKLPQRRCGAEQNLRKCGTYNRRSSASSRKRFLCPSHLTMTYARICRYHWC